MFGWFFADDFAMVVGIFLTIAFAFLLVSAVVWNRTKRMADLMNEHMKGYQQDKAPDSEERDERQVIFTSPFSAPLKQASQSASCPLCCST